MKHTSYVHFIDPFRIAGGVCIAYEPTTEHYRNRTPHVLYKMTTVYCHPNDNYNRKLGRRMADFNLSNGQWTLVRVPSGESPREFFFNLAESICY